MTRPRIGHDQRCDCKDDPLPSGRHYLGWEMCDACGLFIVRSPAIVRQLKAERLRAEEIRNRRQPQWDKSA